MKPLIRIVGIILIILLSSCESRSGKREYQHTNVVSKVEDDGFLAVKKVVDGDTFWVDNGTQKGIKVRLIGIDAPESRNVFKKRVGYYGKESKLYLTQLIQGKQVKLVSDVDSLDRYGRTLAYAFLKDGKFINAELVKEGYAMTMTIPPNVRYAEKFVSLQREARNNNKGLWNKAEF